MLILTRRVDEVVNIYRAGELLARVTMVRVEPNSVRLGFAADPDVLFVRNEIDSREGVRYPQKRARP